MLTLRAYQKTDAETILSWCREERGFYQWTAGVMGDYPLTAEQFGFVENLLPLTAWEDDRLVGFFTLREASASPLDLRFGFVIVDPALRGTGIGKKMLQLGLKKAFSELQAQCVSLVVFENNVSAHRCYLSAGFQEVMQEKQEIYSVLGEQWLCRELKLTREQWEQEQ